MSMVFKLPAFLSLKISKTLIDDDDRHKSPDGFEMHFESESHNTEDFSEKKPHLQMEDYQNKQSHFSQSQRSPHSSNDKIPIQIIKYNVKKNIFEFNDQAEEVLKNIFLKK